MTTFKEFNLKPELMASLQALAFVEPTPVQEQVIPFLLKSKKDLIALAQTGTGKTAAYALPILQLINGQDRKLQAIILCPTRELCLQISQDIKAFAQQSPAIKVTAVYGGENIEWQIKSLKSGTNIVVGTPGRVHDLIRRKVLQLQSIEWLVLDEADEMLDMGFKDDLDSILEQTPTSRQTLLFSATMSKSVNAIARRYMTEAQEIIVGARNVGAEKVAHEYYVVQARDRFEALKRILDSLPGVYGILFCRTRNETQVVADKLKLAHYDSEALHGEITQSTRTKIMDRFKRQQVRLLVATDVAARGIDVSNLSHVINYNLPDHDESYTHRTGRTGRAQNSGVAISIVSPRETGRIRKLEEMIGKKFTCKTVPSGTDICRKQIDSFLEEITKIEISELGQEQYFVDITEKLKDVSKEDLIKHVISHKLSSLLATYQNAPNLSNVSLGSDSNRANSDFVNLKINVGKKHGLDVKALFSLVNANRKLKGLAIGKISLLPEQTIFAVESSRAQEALQYLQGANFRGKKINISKGADAPDYISQPRGQSRGQSRKPSGRRFESKPRNFKRQR
ncbi:MAG: DEAD/DEAH box helicase [bacterium]